MANNLKSKLKRLGSKRRSDADSSADYTDSQTESIGSSRNSTLGAPPSMPAPTAPRKSEEGPISRDSSSGSNVVPLKTPGAGPKAETESSEATRAAVIASQSPRKSLPENDQRLSNSKEPMEAPKEKKLPVAGSSIIDRPVPAADAPAPSPAPAASQPSSVATHEQTQEVERPEAKEKKPDPKSKPKINPRSEGSPSTTESNRQPEAPLGTPDAEERPLEIKTVGSKQYVFKQRPDKSMPSNPSSLPVHRPVSARLSPMQSPINSRSGSPAPSPRIPKHATFLIDSKHGQSHSVSGRPLSRSSSRIALQRTPSMAQIARDNKSHMSNDTRHFYQHSHSGNSGGHIDARPSLSRKSSYADDKRAMEYISNKNSETTAESSNLMFRTSSRIWDANKESDMWFNYESRSRISSRRESVASSDTDSEEDENLHPGRFISRSGSFASDEDEEAEFADSYIIRAADWLLGIPHDSPHTLRNTFKRKPKPMSLLDKRRLREANVATDPAFLLAAYLSLREAMS